MRHRRSSVLALWLSLAASVGISVMAGALPNDTRVADAARRGDKEAVRALLKQGADVNAAHGDGSTALHWAATKDDVEMAQILLYAGANVKATSRIGGISPLIVASRNGHAPMLDLLLKAGANPNATIAGGLTPLMLAATAGDAAAVKLLLEKGAAVNAKETTHGQTPLMFAAANNRAAAIKVLMASGADSKVTTQIRMPQQRGGFRGLPQPGQVGQPGQPGPAGPAGPAAQPGQPAGQQQGQGQRQGQRGGRGQQPQPDDDEPVIAAMPMGGLTPLLYAARQNNFDAARALLDGGANINQSSAGDRTTPLMISTINGHFDLSMLLLERGADPTLATMAGATPLYGAINVQWAPKAMYPEPSTRQEKTTLIELMDALLQRGADPNIRLTRELWYTSYAQRLNGTNVTGATPFWRAAQVGDVDAMRLLLARGANPNIATAEGVTPLLALSGSGFYGNDDRAVPAGRMPATRYLVEELHANVNAADTGTRGGHTAIHNAASRGDNEMILYLVSKGAKVDAVSKTGQTTVDMANGPRQRIQPFSETVALLMNLGAKNSHKCVSC